MPRQAALSQRDQAALLPPETKLMSEKIAAGEFFQ
jgi:hypothetical protein